MLDDIGMYVVDEATFLASCHMVSLCSLESTKSCLLKRYVLTSHVDLRGILGPGLDIFD